MDQGVIKFILFLFFFLFSFLFSSLSCKLIIKISRKKKFGQSERDYLATHKAKEGTPSMGGIGIIISALFGYISSSFIYGFDTKITIVIVTFLIFALIGFLDDFLKIKFKNSKGLSSKIRLIAELATSLWFLYFLGFNQLGIQLYRLKLVDLLLNIGIFVIPLFVFMLIGGSNATNLSDGLDGLSSGLLMMAIFPFLIVSIKMESWQYSFFLISIIGGIMGFLIHNVHPAKIFMGDVGSLSLGALIVMSAIILDAVILLPLAMIVFILETLSVIIQVIYYKKTKKRVFLMTPLHHHYEKKNIPEYRIVMYFWLLGLSFSLLACFLGGL